ncbi:MAG: response regulator transcription factor [Gammaproteobacteria bacterium]|nr:response regulator transcription factor [Gammaproteobacteria bacterium]
MNILVVDDHKLFLDGFCLLLNKLNHNVSIRAFESGERALTAYNNSSDWDLIILDITLPDIDGLEVLKMIRKQGGLTPVVFVSATENVYKIACTYFHGANGFIPKACDTQVMLSALQLVIDGEIYFYPDLKVAINLQLNELSKNHDVSDKLTNRQFEVLKIMAKGASNKEIAETLFISEPTVKSHISIIYQLFDVNKRVECIRKAEWLGLV